VAELPTPNTNQTSLEGIDLNKLRVIIWKNISWIIAILLITNAVAFLIIRYTKDLYESSSEIKLDIKNEASELGFKTFAPDEPQNADIISGEIEIIRSKLFLNKVLDSLNLDVSYFSKGEVLNHELFTNTPFFISFNITNPKFFNSPFYLEEEKGNAYVLRWNESPTTLHGRFNESVSIDGITLTLRKNPHFIKDQEIDFFFIINSRDALLANLTANLTAEPLNFYAKTIRIAFKDNNPNKANAIIHAIDNIYLTYSYEQKSLANKQKIDWLNNELHQIEMKMEGYEDYFKKFTLENKTNNLDEDLKKTVASLNRVDSQRYELNRRITEINKLMDGLQSKEIILTPAMRQVMPIYLTNDIDQMQVLFVEMEKMKLSYNEITFTYKQRQQEIDTYIRKVSQQLAALKTDWLKKLQDVNNHKRQLEQEFINMPDKSTQYSKNQRFYKLYEEFYLSLMQSKSGFEIAQAGTIPDFKILSPATLPTKPISPNRLIIAGIGLVSGFVIVVFFIGILYIINDKITNLHELERISGIPVLGVVPSSRYSKSESLHVLTHPKSIVSESIRTLRTNLEFFRLDSPQKVIAISSTISGEGKSFVALNLGAAIALSHKKVLLVDLDMRKVKRDLPIEITDTSKGISTVLINKNSLKECILKTKLEFLDYLPSGPTPPNPSELLLNGVFSKVLEEMKKEYDYIVLDTPPVGLITDGIQAMKKADISIYIFRANYSRRDFLLNMHRIVTINKVTNITSLLNAMPSTGDRAYGYGYGYYEQTGNKGLSKIRSFLKL